LRQRKSAFLNASFSYPVLVNPDSRENTRAVREF
jgi:hypothetical protein